MKAEAIAHLVKDGSNSHFWLRILAPDPGHVPAAELSVEQISYLDYSGVLQDTVNELRDMVGKQWGDCVTNLNILCRTRSTK